MNNLEAINELNIKINKKEDDIINIINEKDNEIKELKTKLDAQENKINIINNKLKTIINVFINEFKEKDNEIKNIEEKLLIPKNLIKNYLEEEIKDYINEQKNIILKDLNEKYDELNLKIDKEKEIRERKEDEEEKRKIHLEYNEKLQEKKLALIKEEFKEEIIKIELKIEEFECNNKKNYQIELEIAKCSLALQKIKNEIEEMNLEEEIILDKINKEIELKLEKKYKKEEEEPKKILLKKQKLYNEEIEKEEQKNKNIKRIFDEEKLMMKKEIERDYKFMKKNNFYQKMKDFIEDENNTINLNYE